GQPGRPDRPAPPARGRPGRVRPGIGAGRRVRLGRPAHRVPGAHGHRRRCHHAGHAVDPHQRVHQPSRAGQGDRRLVGGGGSRRRHRPQHGRLAAGALRLGINLHGEPAHRDRGTGGRPVRDPALDQPAPQAPRPGRGCAVIAGLLAVVYAIIEAPRHGWLSGTTVGIAAGGLAILAAWVAVELRSSHPMVDLHVFANARFSAASFAVTMIFFALFGWLFLFTQQMQFVIGYSALQAGVRTLPFALAMGVTSAVSAKLAARAGTKLAVAAGLAFMAAGFGLMTTSTVHPGSPFLALASVILAIGMGLAMAPATESIMGSLPPAQAGVGSAVNDTTREIGGAGGVAVTGSVASSVFSSH